MNFWNKQFRRITFLMAFPGIVIFVNISLYFFVALYYFTSVNLKGYAKKIPFNFHLWLILFIVGSAVSVFNSPYAFDSPNFAQSLRVLPNYIYWIVLVLFFLRYRALFDYDVFQKAVFWAVTIYIPFWFIRQNFLPGVPFVQKTSGNNLAFLMVCYSSIALSYVKENFKKGYWKWIYFAIVLLLMLFLERRAGFLLVFISGMLTIFIIRFRLRHVLNYGLFILVIFLIGQIQFVEQKINEISPEIHQIIYETDEMQSTDRSYLVRVAMWEKAVDLFSKYPVSGVGLQNFFKTEGDFEGDFVGAKYVLGKDINSLSAHNSYAAVLAEGGAVLFLPWIMILLSIAIGFIRVLNFADPKFYPIFYSFFGMIVHFSAITAYVNVYSWYIIAVSMIVITVTIEQTKKLN